MAWTDERLQALAATPKRIARQAKKWKLKGGHFELNMELEDREGNRFSLYIRQNSRLADDYSAGIKYCGEGGEGLTLARYDGSTHMHVNRIGRERMAFAQHIHRARQEYIDAGYKTDGYAESTQAYKDVAGAASLLAKEYNIEGGIVVPLCQLRLVP